jgi:hypothetical protein
MNKLTLKETLFLGFCAVFILFSRASMRLHLGIPGHAMFFTVYFLLLARGCISARFSATLTGLLAGSAAVILGMGKGGPLILVKFLLPAVAIDIGAAILPGMFQNYILCALVGAVAASTKLLETFVVDKLFGMDQTIILNRILLGAFYTVAFGVAGSLFISPVIRKLKAYGVILEKNE